MKICYKEIKFRPDSLALIQKVNQIINEYHAMGYDLTLRQIYYQLVARDIIPNNERSYKNLGNLVSDGRLAGLIDWTAIIDRTRNLEKNSHWNSPADIIEVCAQTFQFDKWEGQQTYMEVWVEKDALKGVVGKTCEELDIPYFSCRGYVSQSEMWEAAKRLSKQHQERGIYIIHLGDHDPSGRDMSRDVHERLKLFDCYPYFERIALNMEQIEKYGPPPNPTKVTDSRANGYIADFGHKCWELDALRPEVIDSLIREAVAGVLDMELFEDMKKKEQEARSLLTVISENWESIENTYGPMTD